MKRLTAVLLVAIMAAGMMACGSKEEAEEAEEAEIQVFIAASLNTVMTELAEMYNEEHPEVTITYNADSSGTLMTQIEEGYECYFLLSSTETDGSAGRRRTGCGWNQSECSQQPGCSCDIEGQ